MPGQRELSDWEFIQEFLRFFGPGRALALMGWCLWWAMNGRRSFADLQEFIQEQRKQGGWSRTRTYAAVADMRRFRYHWAQIEGRELEAEDVASRVLGASDALRAASPSSPSEGRPAGSPPDAPSSSA